MDNSDFEGAKIIQDLNKEIPKNLENRFDTLIDFGTTEHIFNVNQVIQNYVKMIKPQGVIVHVLPANNFLGHGFYQFSPELFYSLYKPENGFEKTKVYLVEHKRNGKWYRVSAPRNGERALFKSKSPTSVVCITTKSKDAFGQVWQSDYEYSWEQTLKENLHEKYFLTKRLQAAPVIFNILKYSFRGILWLRSKIPDQNRQKYIKKIKVNEMFKE